MDEPLIDPNTGVELITTFLDDTTGLVMLWVFDDPDEPGRLGFELDVTSETYSDGVFTLSRSEVVDLRDALNLYLQGAGA